MSIFDALVSMVSGQKAPPPPPPQQQRVGMEDADKSQEAELFRLQASCHEETQISRRYEVRRMMRARSYYKGQQDIYWNEQSGEFTVRTPGVGYDNNPDESVEDPEPFYPINIFRSTGHSLIAVLSGTLPVVRYFPKDARNPDDVATARAADDIIDLFYRQSDIHTRQAEQSFYLYTDGLYGIYIRYVEDGERFGFDEIPTYAPVDTPIGPPTFVCQQCGMPTQGPQCQACGGQANQFPPEMTTVPREGTPQLKPKGGVVATVVGGLELVLPPDARDEHDAQWLSWRTEVDASKLRALYPHVAEKLKQGSTHATPQEELERTFRMSLKTKTGTGGILTPVDDISKKVTFTRTWFRPSAFHRIENNAVRDQLLQQFPHGCMVAFAGNVLCETRNESFDEHWVIAHAFPGDGQVRESMGDSLLEIQDVTNDLVSLEIAAARQSISTIFADQRAVNLKAWGTTKVVPGRIYPITRQGMESISSNFFAMEPAQVGPSTTALRQEISGPIAQNLSGALPAMIGGEMDSQRTMGGYRMARDQALGRLGLPWRAMKRAHVQMCKCVVQEYIRWVDGDRVIPDMKAPGFQNRVIKKADLQGEIEAYAEGDESFPISPSDKRAVVQAYMMSPDPIFHGAVISPENFDVVKDIVGLPELVLPGQKSREKQLRELQALLDGVPTTDPMSGQMVPSIQTGPLDNHQVHLQTLQAWAESEEAEEVMKTNMQGYQNVLLHAQAHQQALAPPPVPPPPGAPGGQAGTSVGAPAGAPTGQPVSGEPGLQPENQEAAPPPAPGGLQ